MAGVSAPSQRCLQFVLLPLILAYQAACLRCFCNQERAVLVDCLNNHTCEASVACYAQYTYIEEDKSVLFLHFCLNHLDPGGGFCSTNLPHLTAVCCNNSDECNRDLRPPFPSLYLEAISTDNVTESSTLATGDVGGNQAPLDSTLIAVVVVIPIISVILIIAMLVGTILFMCYCLHKRRQTDILQQSDVTMTKLDPPPPPGLYPAYSLDTLNLLNQSCTSGSGSGEPILTQRTIARNITIGEQVGNGRFGLVYVGMYQGDEMAVKKFASRDEQSWMRETEIYNTVLLRHDNILGFFASDIFSNNGVTELWLITQYHPYGSLYDYLNKRTLTPSIMMRMAISTCRGLTHLHTEFKGSIAKPAIAHRDIKSRNILVKRNRECCIADFGLAVMKSANGEMNFPTNPKQGTKRYMAPEVLNETIDMNNFESFLSVDIYAFGLVLWEMCKRTGDKNETIGEYEAPFENLVGQDPTFEEMRKIVVHDRQKPLIPPHWHNSDLLRGMHHLMDECWFFNSSARNSAVYYKMKLYKLAEEDKIKFEHDDHE